MKVHPITAAFAVLLVLGSLYLPPYMVNAEHWVPFVAAAAAIRHGDWPLLAGYDSGYGLLCPAFLAAWLFCFGLSKLSLSALIMFSNLVAGAASFLLIRGLTSSRLLALVGALYPLQGLGGMTAVNAQIFAVSSTFRAPVQIALGALLLYLSLRERGGRLWPGFLFGVTVLWNPSFGAFAAAGFFAAHGYLVWRSDPARRVQAMRPILAMLAGIALPLAAIAAFSSSVAALRDWYAGSMAAAELSLLGYANLAQQFDPIVTAGFSAGALYLGLVLRRISRGMGLSRKYLFVGASFIATMPYAAYALGRSESMHFLPSYWCLIPVLALFAAGFLRLFRLRSTIPAAVRSVAWSRSGAAAAGLLALIGGALWQGAFPFERILAPTLLAASYERFERTPQARGGEAPVDVDPRLIAACRAGLPVLSYSDGWIHALGDCYSPIRLPSVIFLITRSELQRASKLFASQRVIVFDRTTDPYAGWRGDMLEDIKARLASQGFVETGGCGRFSVLSRADPTPVLHKLCG